MARLVLTDASPLIGLARLDGLTWLGALFGVVWMPDEVRREVLSGSGAGDGRGESVSRKTVMNNYEFRSLTSVTETKA